MTLSKLALGLVTIVAVTTLFFAYRAESNARYDSVHERLRADCARWKSAGGARYICDPDEAPPSLFPRLKAAKANVASARASLAVGAMPAAQRDLTRALDTVSELDRLGSPIAAMMAGTLLHEVLDVLESMVPPTPSGRSLVAALVEGRRLRAVAHPLEGHRLFASTALASTARYPFVRGLAVDMMTEEDAVTAAMERAIASGDVQGCIRAGQGRSRLVSRHIEPMIETTCSKLVLLDRAAKRLDRIRAASLDAAGTRG